MAQADDAPTTSVLLPWSTPVLTHVPEDQFADATLAGKSDMGAAVTQGHSGEAKLEGESAGAVDTTQAHFIGEGEKVFMSPAPYTLGMIEGVRRVLQSLPLRLQSLLPRRIVLRPGRPPVYDLPAINAVIEEVAKRGVDDRFDWFVERVHYELQGRRIKAPKRTRLKELCRPIYARAMAAELPTITD